MRAWRKKPVTVLAIPEDEVRLWFSTNRRENLPSWINDAFREGVLLWGANGLVIDTLEGEMEVGEGDMIIQGVKGELYPCKKDIFEATYERIEVV